MSEFKIRKLTDRAGTGAPNFTYGFNINGSDSGISAFTHTEGATEPSSPSNGDTWWNTDNDSFHVYIDSEWKAWLGDTYVPAGTYYGDRGLRFGGYDTGVDHSNVIDYWDITSAGNATDFGDLTQKRSYIASCSNSTRAVSMGGQSVSPLTGGSDIIDYVTISTTGNATDFGDMLSARNRAACESNGTRAIHGGGESGGTDVNTIEYVTIATTGNSTDFGDLTVARERLSAASNGSRIVFNGGSASSKYNTMDYVTGDTTGNATDFGDLLTVLTNHGATGTGTGDRAIVFGGNPSSGYHNVIQYFAVSTTGNSADFGDLTGDHAYASACCNATKAQFVGGYGPSDINVIQEVTMATLGNAVDFGDITEAVYSSGATSGAAS